MSYDLNTCSNLPASSSSSCSGIFYQGKTSSCRCNTCSRCRNSSCPDNLFSQHTYGVLKKICRKILKDYTRQQRRESYTLFEGGNSVNARVHRRGSSDQRQDMRFPEYRLKFGRDDCGDTRKSKRDSRDNNVKYAQDDSTSQGRSQLKLDSSNSKYTSGNLRKVRGRSQADIEKNRNLKVGKMKRLSKGRQAMEQAESKQSEGGKIKSDVSPRKSARGKTGQGDVKEQPLASKKSRASNDIVKGRSKKITSEVAPVSQTKPIKKEDESDTEKESTQKADDSKIKVSKKPEGNASEMAENALKSQSETQGEFPDQQTITVANVEVKSGGKTASNVSKGTSKKPDNMTYTNETITTTSTSTNGGPAKVTSTSSKKQGTGRVSDLLPKLGIDLKKLPTKEGTYIEETHKTTTTKDGGPPKTTVTRSKRVYPPGKAPDILPMINNLRDTVRKNLGVVPTPTPFNRNLFNAVPTASPLNRNRTNISKRSKSPYVKSSGAKIKSNCVLPNGVKQHGTKSVKSLTQGKPGQPLKPICGRSRYDEVRPHDHLRASMEQRDCQRHERDLQRQQRCYCDPTPRSTVCNFSCCCSRSLNTCRTNESCYF